MLPETSQLGWRGRVNMCETKNNSPVLSNKVVQDFKGINDESDLGDGRSWEGSWQTSIQFGPGRRDPPKEGNWAVTEPVFSTLQPVRECSHPPCPQHLLQLHEDQTTHGCSYQFGSSVVTNSTSILYLLREKFCDENVSQPLATPV